MDSNILIYIQEYIRNDILTPFMVMLTHTGDYGILAIAVTIILILIKRTRCLGHVIGFGIGIESIITNVLLKNMVARTRPYEVIEELEILIGAQPDYSFPSGHSGVTFALAGALLYAFIYGVPGFGKNKRNSIIVLVVLLYAVLLAFSRLYVGVHYPTDVLAGMLIGFISGFAGYYVEKKVRAVWEGRLSRKATERSAIRQ